MTGDWKAAISEDGKVRQGVRLVCITISAPVRIVWCRAWVGGVLVGSAESTLERTQGLGWNVSELAASPGKPYLIGFGARV